MNDRMTKARFLEIMRTERAQWEALLSEVVSARMTQAGVEGEWSVKDIVAHVTAYERWLVQWLETVSRGELPEPSPLENPDVDQRNALIYAENHHRSLSDVLKESRQVSRQLLERVNALGEDDLTDARRTEWFVIPYWKESRPLWQCLAGDSYRHYRQHIPSMRTWLGESGTHISYLGTFQREESGEDLS